MKCKDCPYFKIRQMPIKGWDLGMAECKKHKLVVDFDSMRKVNTLECVEDADENRKQEQEESYVKLAGEDGQRGQA